MSAKLTGRVTQQEVAGRKYLLEHTPANCVLNGEKAGNERPRTVEGLTAYQVESGPWTFWRAAALGCFPIAVTLASTGTTVSLTKLEIGEPDAVYFDPGDSFKSVKPSELPTLFDPNFTPPAFIGEKLSKADAAWEQRQQWGSFVGVLTTNPYAGPETAADGIIFSTGGPGAENPSPWILPDLS